LGSHSDCPDKIPPSWCKQIALDLFQRNSSNPGKRVVKCANSKKRERSNSIPSTKSVLAQAMLPEVSPTEPDATDDAGKQVGESLAENLQMAICGDWMARMDQDAFPAPRGSSQAPPVSTLPVFSG